MIGLTEEQYSGSIMKKDVIFNQKRNNFFSSLQQFESYNPDPSSFMWYDFFSTILILDGQESFDSKFGYTEGCDLRGGLPDYESYEYNYTDSMAESYYQERFTAINSLMKIKCNILQRARKRRENEGMQTGPMEILIIPQKLTIPPVNMLPLKKNMENFSIKVIIFTSSI